MAFTIITGGSFTSTGAGVKIPLPSSADYFKTWNITQSIASNPNTVIQGEWFGSKFGSGASAPGLGIQLVKTTFNLTSQFSAGLGFTYVTTVPYVEAAVTGTTISQAAGAVAAATNTYSNGDRVRIYNSTGMLQIAGMEFTISSVSGSGFTLLGLDSSGFAAGASAFQVRRVSALDAVEPATVFITAISKATQAVVTTSTDVSSLYVVGMKVHFSIPSGMGMPEMNGLTGIITAVGAYTSNATYNITVNIDSSAFTTFAFPASTATPTAGLFATFAPAGASTTFNPVTLVTTGYDFSKQPFRTGQFTPYMFLSGGAQSPAGAANDIINWTAYKFEN